MRALFPLLAAGLILSSCGGGGSSSPAPPVVTPPPVPPPASQDFSSVGAEVERFSVADVTLVIGDSSGELYRYEKGAVTADTPLGLASASKLLSGVALWTLIEDGTLSLDDTPQDHIPGWTSDPSDPRARITLDHLLSYRSGFNTRPSEATCAGRPDFSLRQCVTQIYQAGTQSEPGEGFAYGSSHSQVAALMAREARGQDLHATVSALFDSVGASASAGFPAQDNTRYSANARASADDYGRLLTALLAGRLVADLPGYLSDRTDGARVIYRPFGDNAALDWHYGAGFWIECDTVPFSDDCAGATATISSPGARGFTPWVDFETGYWAVLAMEQAGASAAAVTLQQTLQPMIAAEF